MSRAVVAEPVSDSVTTPGLLAFERLDRILAAATEAARIRYLDAGPDAAAYRGLYVTAEDVSHSLGFPPGAPLVAAAPAAPAGPDWAAIVRGDPPWAQFRDAYGLGDAELDVVLIALAPDLDRRYERTYAYLQDDVTCKRATVALVLDLLPIGPRERLEAFGLFAADAPLLRNHILALHPDPRAVAPPLIGHHLALDERITSRLLGLPGLDRRLVPFCRLVPASEARSEAAPGRFDDGRAVRLCLYGRPGSGRGKLAGRLAAGQDLLVVDTPLLAAEPALLEHVLDEARFRAAVTYFADADALFLGEGRERFTAGLAAHEGVVIMSARHGWTPGGAALGVLNVPCPAPTELERAERWQQHGPMPEADLSALAGRFRLTAAQIADSAQTARTAAQFRAGPGAAPTRAELFRAARGQGGHELARLARPVEPRSGWADIVLTADAAEQLHDLCDRVALRRQVMDEWGFERQLSHGRGTSVLFAGPSGTGKTMAAEVVARELGVDLFKIDLSTVVSKYIGETEKNLERIFAAAEDADAILFFDEADALFGKRSEVRDAHDRYANIEVSYLLQRMEDHDGLTVLATNLRQHLDEAFLRRLQFVVDFPFPGDGERARIWEVSFPPETPRTEMDLGDLARRYPLTGGHIRNIVLAAAYAAAADGQPVSSTHVHRAAAREYRKLGKVLPGGEA